MTAIPLISAVCFAGAAFCVGLLIGIALRYGPGWDGWGFGPPDPPPADSPGPRSGLTDEEVKRLQAEALSRFDAFDILN